MVKGSGESHQTANGKSKSKTPGGRARYKYCVVPGCRSTTVSCPGKLFFSVPVGAPRRRWCELMGRGAAHRALAATCNRFCCQDHFDLEKDMENYLHWKLMGIEQTKKLKLKKGVVPHKFECQGELHPAQPPAAPAEDMTDYINSVLHERQEKTVSEKDAPNQTLHTKGKRRITNDKKRKSTVKENPQDDQKLKESVSATEEEKIAEQKKKIEKISYITKEITTQDQHMETYTFHIKVESDDDSGDSVLEEFIVQDARSRGRGSSSDANGKVGELEPQSMEN